MIADWATLRAAAIRSAWSQAKRQEPLDKIEPLP